MSGAVIAGHRASKMTSSSAESCIFCNSMTPETTHHLFWECTAWKGIREKHALALQAWKPDWPACFACCGILTDGVCIDSPAVDRGGHGPVVVPDSQPQFVMLEEHLSDGHVVVFTDGACVHNQCQRLRKAGLGAWWADDHANNVSEPLPGAAQTNQRAELLAVIRVLQIENRPVHVKTDSKYVLDGCLRNRFAWAAMQWRRVSNADLWKQLHSLLQKRAASFRITKVKGHATASDVAAGRVAFLDKFGNDAADALARKGAAIHAPSKDIVRAVRHRFAVTKSVQHMMVDILLARSACKPTEDSSSSSSLAGASSDDTCSSSTESSTSSESDGHVVNIAQTSFSAFR